MTLRNAWVDAARGAALIPMVIFHFAVSIGVQKGQGNRLNVFRIPARAEV